MFYPQGYCEEKRVIIKIPLDVKTKMRVERYIALSVPVPPATVTHNKPNHRSDRLIKSYLEDANGGIPARIKGGDLDGLNNGKLDGVSDDSPINLDSPEQKDNQGKDGC